MGDAMDTNANQLKAEETRNPAISAEAVAALRAPLPPAAISQHPTKTYLSSIKPPYVIQRLNDVFGLAGWQDEYEIISADKRKKINKSQKEYETLEIVVKGWLRMSEFGIVRTAFGGNEQEDFGDAYKGACSDALTKMAMMVGIGIDVYMGLGTKTALEPAARSDYQTIQGVLSDQKTDEHGYWFNVGGKAVFKDEQSPVDAQPIVNAAPGSTVKLRVIERKRGQKTFYELAEVLGEVTPPGVQQPASEPVKTQPTAGKVITESQSKRLFAISRSHGWSDDERKDLLKAYGFGHSTEITVDKYNEIITKIEARLGV